MYNLLSMQVAINQSWFVSTNYLVQLPIKRRWMFLHFLRLATRSNWCICFSDYPVSFQVWLLSWLFGFILTKSSEASISSRRTVLHNSVLDAIFHPLPWICFFLSSHIPSLVFFCLLMLFCALAVRVQVTNTSWNLNIGWRKGNLISLANLMSLTNPSNQSSLLFFFFFFCPFFLIFLLFSSPLSLVYSSHHLASLFLQKSTYIWK